MTTEQKLEEMENSIEQIMTAQTENSHKLDEVLVCLKGGGLTGEGLVAKVTRLEDTVQQMKNEKLSERTEVSFYKGQIKWFAAAIGLLALAYFFNQLITLLNKS